MIVWVDDLLFKGGARDVDLIALLRSASIRRHTLVVSGDPHGPLATGRSPNFDNWILGLSSRVRREVELLREQLCLISAQALAYGTERLFVSSNDPEPSTAGCWVKLEDAIRAVALPTFVLVENVVNDRAFLLRVMPPVWRDRLHAWEKSGALRFEHGGGANIPLILGRFAEEPYAKQAFGLSSQVWALVHVVVYDHDGDSADKPGPTSNQINSACAKAQLASRSHRLLRRKQEYYLPRQALEAILLMGVTSEHDREVQLNAIDTYMKQDESRHFAPLPSATRLKNSFDSKIQWNDEWFQQDGAWPEMTRIAEMIAAAV